MPMIDDRNDPSRPPSAATDAAANGESEARIKELEGALEAARQEARQQQDRWLRERADLENLKKRAARERAETISFARMVIHTCSRGFGAR